MPGEGNAGSPSPSHLHADWLPYPCASCPLPGLCLLHMMQGLAQSPSQHGSGLPVTCLVQLRQYFLAASSLLEKQPGQREAALQQSLSEGAPAHLVPAHGKWEIWGVVEEQAESWGELLCRGLGECWGRTRPWPFQKGAFVAHTVSSGTTASPVRRNLEGSQRIIESLGFENTS